MKLNYYIIASLPEIQWEGDLKGTLAEFLEANGFVFDDYRETIDAIIINNEIRNLELLLKSKFLGEEGEADLFVPALVSSDQALRFLEMPFANQPEEYPDYFTDYFSKYHDTEERLGHIDELYLSYYNTLAEKDDQFLKFFAHTVQVFKTVVMAFRLREDDLQFEDMLIGDQEVVDAIISHRNAADFGLKSIFPEIGELAAHFEREALDLEKELDLFLLNLLEQYKEDDLFGDHVIYLYIIALFFRDRWCLLDSDKSEQILEEIIHG